MNQRETFDELVRRTQHAVRAYIAGMGIASHEVDDIAQEVYLELYKNLQKMPRDVEPIRWLKGIARNLSLNHIRKSARRGRIFQQAIFEILARTNTDVEETMEQTALPRVLKSCRDKLPDKSKKLLVLRYEEDLSSQKIAERMETTPEAVRISLFRIRNRLKDCISSSLSHESWR